VAVAVAVAVAFPGAAPGNGVPGGRLKLDRRLDGESTSRTAVFRLGT